MTQIDTLRLEPDFLDKLINEYEAADFIGHSVRTLQKWRVNGGGPRYIRISSRSIRYRRKDLIEWIEARSCSHTSEYVA